MKGILGAAVLATTLMSAGCASIISDSSYPVTINSSPDAMWKLNDNMMVSLGKKEDSAATDKTMSVITIDQVPKRLRGEMVRLN